MKRNADLIRKILLEIESHDDLSGPTQLDIEGYTPEQITYHIILLDEAGLIVAYDKSTFGGTEWSVDRLTWHGHEFLDAAKNDQHWSKVKDVLGKTGGVVITVAEKLLIELATSQALKTLS